MAKYTPEQLHEMADVFLFEYNMGNMICDQVLMFMAQQFGGHPEHFLNEIRKL